MMRNPSGMRVALACGLLAGVSVFCAAQTYTPPPPPLTMLPPCLLGKDGKPLKKQKNCDPTIYPLEKVEPKGKKSPDAAAQQTGFTGTVNIAPATPAAQAFPFPGEQPAKSADTPAAKAFPFPGSDDPGKTSHDSDVPHDPAAEKKAADTPAGKAFPFPGGSTADMPVDPDMPAPEKKADDVPASSSSSSPSDTGAEPSSSSGANADDAPGPKGEYDDDGSTPAKLKDKGRRKAPKPQTDTERVDEDLSIAKYYGQSGNKMGAYLRAKDAVKTQPDYAEAHFVLGQAAQRLQKKDEALAEFKEYLKLAPDGEKAKAAEKALEDLH